MKNIIVYVITIWNHIWYIYCCRHCENDMSHSGKRLHSYGKPPCYIGKPIINHIFNRYVSLPEGTVHDLALTTEHPILFEGDPSSRVVGQNDRNN